MPTMLRSEALTRNWVSFGFFKMGRWTVMAIFDGLEASQQ